MCFFPHISLQLPVTNWSCLKNKNEGKKEKFSISNIVLHPAPHDIYNIKKWGKKNVAKHLWWTFTMNEFFLFLSSDAVYCIQNLD